MDAKQIKPILLFSEENNVLNLNKDKINEALSNIISNAVKYNKVGGELRVAGKITANENARIVINANRHTQPSFFNIHLRSTAFRGADVFVEEKRKHRTPTSNSFTGT